MAKHRQDDEADPTQLLPKVVLPAESPPPVGSLLPATVEQLAAAERASLRRWPKLRQRALLAAVAAVVLVTGGGGLWVLTHGPDPLRLFPPPDVGSQPTGDAPLEGFGQAPSAHPSASPAPRLGPRVLPSPSVSGQPFASPTAPDPMVTQAPMLAHYRFDESSGTTAGDASGGDRTATLSGGASFVSGRMGNAIGLSGSSQYVSMPSGILGGAKEFTFAAWLRLDRAGTWTRVFDFGTGTSTNMFLTVRSDTGTPRFAITTGGNSKEQRINGPAALPTGTWTHVAVTLSGGVGILYVNRAEVARTTGMTLTPASLGGSTSRNWIGRSQYGADPYLDGTVDDVRLYARALPAAEIAALP